MTPSTNPQPLDDLAEAARESLLHPGKPLRVLVHAPWSLRIAAGVLDVAVYAVASFVIAMIALMTYMATTRDDFDGPAIAEAAGEWFIFFAFSAAFLLCTAAEILDGTSIGKLVFRLRVLSEEQESLEAARRALRWAVRWSAVLTFVAISLVAFLWLNANRSDFDMQTTAGFHVTMRRLALVFPAAATLLHPLCLFIFRGRPLHDVLARTRVFRLSGNTAHRAFSPILFAQAPA
jgi:hypothetical protein